LSLKKGPQRIDEMDKLFAKCMGKAAENPEVEFGDYDTEIDLEKLSGCVRELPLNTSAQSVFELRDAIVKCVGDKTSNILLELERLECYRKTLKQVFPSSPDEFVPEYIKCMNRLNQKFESGVDLGKLSECVRKLSRNADYGNVFEFLGDLTRCMGDKIPVTVKDFDILICYGEAYMKKFPCTAIEFKYKFIRCMEMSKTESDSSDSSDSFELFMKDVEAYCKFLEELRDSIEIPKTESEPFIDPAECFDELLQEFISYDFLFRNDYLSILLYFLFAVFLSYVILSFSYLLAVQKPGTEKMSVYECGFEPYEDARQKFDVYFYLIAILFILFDIEAMFLIPWCMTLPLINYVVYFIVMLRISLYLVPWVLTGRDL
jgi:NADH:ubiquinone oxidoreductase subunit 3 (subunit A)